MNADNTLQSLGWRPSFSTQLEPGDRRRPARIMAVHRGRVELAGASVPASVDVSGHAAARPMAVGDWVLLDADADRIGTVLTMQTAMGFLLTLLTIQLMPIAVEGLSWRFAFAVLAVGPLFGIVAMVRLRHRPEACRLANGRR